MYVVWRLVLFGACTSLGYLTWEIFLTKLPAHYLILNTFFWLFAIEFLLPWARGKEVPSISWRPSVSAPIFLYSLSHFFYWYCFWIGLTAAFGNDDASGQPASTLALVFLSLTMIVSPLLTGFELDKRQRLPRYAMICFGLLLVCSVFLVKLETTLNKFTDMSALLGGFWDNIPMYPAMCFVLAVFAESLADYFQYRLNSTIAGEKDNEYLPYKSDFPECFTYNGVVLDTLATEKNIKDAAGSVLTAWYIVIGLSLSFLLSLLHAETAKINNPGSWQILIWFAALFLLGIVGSAAKTLFVKPLQVGGFTGDGIAPIMAARLVIFLFLALIVEAGVASAVGSHGCERRDSRIVKCVWKAAPEITETERENSFTSEQPNARILAEFNLKLAPKLAQSYCLGLGIILLISAWIWYWLYRRGLLWAQSVTQENSKLAVEKAGLSMADPKVQASVVQLLTFTKRDPLLFEPTLNTDRKLIVAVWSRTLGTVTIKFLGNGLVEWSISIRRPAHTYSCVSSGNDYDNHIEQIIKGHQAISIIRRQ